MINYECRPRDLILEGWPTETQIAALRLLSTGITAKETGEILNLTAATVAGLMRDLYLTLRIAGDCNKLVRAYNLAMKLGWIEPPPFGRLMTFDAQKGWVEV